MNPPSPHRLLAIINSFDWSGHIELGDNDRAWLALRIADALNPPGDRDRCESCGVLKEIVIRTRLGRVCEECLDEFSDEAATQREDMENAG